MGFNLAAKMALWPIGKILWQVDQSELLKFFQSSSDFFFHRPSLFFYYLEKKKKASRLFSFLTPLTPSPLFHLLFLRKEGIHPWVTFCAHETSLGGANSFSVGFRLRSHSGSPPVWAHNTCKFGCYFDLTR